MATEDASKLFVAGLPESITEDVLRQLFEATGGSVIDVSLPRDRATGRPRGFGFVTFSTPGEAASARQSLDGSLQAGRAISVRPFSSEPPRRGEGRSDSPGPSGGGAGEDRTLYVGNLPYDTSQPEVTQLLADNGVSPVVRMHLPAGPDGRLRGFGFVTLASAEAANAAIVSLRGVEVRGRRLMVNIAHPRGSAPPGGGASGPRSGGFRPPREEGGGWGSEPQGPDPFNASPEGSAQSRPDSRRGRPGGGEEEDARKAKKKGAGGGANAGKKRGDKAERGGGGNWRSLKWDEDD